MLHESALAYRRLVLRTARIRLGKHVRIAGLPAILIGAAALAFAACAGLALSAFGIAAVLSAGTRRRGSVPAVAEFGNVVRGALPGLRP